MDNSPHFKGAYAKIERAREHVAELRREVAAFAATHPVKMEVSKPSGGQVGISLAMTFNGVPDRISTILGDALHNLRSALDHAAGDLVRAAKGNPRGVYFPFCDDPADLPDMIRAKKLHRAGPWAVALLESLQPYRGGNIMLRGLHDLDVHDKHQALVPGAASFASPVIRLWDDDGTYNPTVMGDPSVASDFALTFGAESAFVGKEVVETLEGLVQVVVSIVEDFDALTRKPGFPG
jgi:hypothetical protein